MGAWWSRATPIACSPIRARTYTRALMAAAFTLEDATMLGNAEHPAQ